MPNSPMFFPPKIEMFRELRTIQDIEGFMVSGADLLGILSMFDPYGLWRLEIQTGLVYWTRDIFEMHEIEPSPGPINLVQALSYYHPEDRDRFAAAISDVIVRKSGYRAILRFSSRNGGYRFFKSIGRYRVDANGREEIIGAYTFLMDHEPAIALIE